MVHFVHEEQMFMDTIRLSLNVSHLHFCVLSIDELVEREGQRRLLCLHDTQGSKIIALVQI